MKVLNALNIFFKETERKILQFSELPPNLLKLSKQLLRNNHKQELIEANLTEIKLFMQSWSSKECTKAIANLTKQNA